MQLQLLFCCVTPWTCIRRLWTYRKAEGMAGTYSNPIPATAPAGTRAVSEDHFTFTQANGDDATVKIFQQDSGRTSTVHAQNSAVPYDRTKNYPLPFHTRHA